MRAYYGAVQGATAQSSPLELAIDSLRYVAGAEGKPLAHGHKGHPLVLKRQATSRLELPLVLHLPELAHQAKTAQRDCVTVQLHTILYADLPGLGPTEIPVDVRQRVYIPKLPKIEVPDVDITKLGLRKGAATVTLRVTNYEPLPFTAKQVSYRFRVENDLDVKSLVTKDITFRKKGIELLPVHVKLQPKSMLKVLLKTIFKPRQTTYTLSSTATVAAGAASAHDATLHFDSHGTVKDLKELAKAKKAD